MKDLNARAFAWRGIVAAAAGASVMFGSSMVARADDIENDRPVVDATKEALGLSVNGAGTVTLFVKKTNNDGKEGCNLTGQTTLVADVKSSTPSVASVSPSRVTFTSCGDEPILTVSALSA